MHLLFLYDTCIKYVYIKMIENHAMCHFSNLFLHQMTLYQTENSNGNTETKEFIIIRAKKICKVYLSTQQWQGTR